MSGFLEPVASRHGGLLRLYPDPPGMGLSSGEGVNSTLDVLDAVEHYVDETIGTQPFALIGESYGGYLARALARRRAKQVTGLALICPIGTAVARDDRDLPAAEIRRTDPTFWNTLHDTDPAAAESFGELVVVRDAPTYERFASDIAPGLTRGDRTTQARITAAYALAARPKAVEAPHSADQHSSSPDARICASATAISSPCWTTIPTPRSRCSTPPATTRRSNGQKR